MSKFETYKDRNGEYRWNLITNGKIVGASSEGFYSEDYCLENAKKVMIGIATYLKESNNLNNQPKRLISPIKPLFKKPPQPKFNLFDFSQKN